MVSGPWPRAQPETGARRRRRVGAKSNDSSTLREAVIRRAPGCQRGAAATGCTGSCRRPAAPTGTAGTATHPPRPRRSPRWAGRSEDRSAAGRASGQLPRRRRSPASPRARRPAPRGSGGRRGGGGDRGRRAGRISRTEGPLRRSARRRPAGGGGWPGRRAGLPASRLWAGSTRGRSRCKNGFHCGGLVEAVHRLHRLEDFFLELRQPAQPGRVRRRTGGRSGRAGQEPGEKAGRNTKRLARLGARVVPLGVLAHGEAEPRPRVAAVVHQVVEQARVPAERDAPAAVPR